jgi:hypothetical protein
MVARGRAAPDAGDETRVSPGRTRVASKERSRLPLLGALAVIVIAVIVAVAVLGTGGGGGAAATVSSVPPPPDRAGAPATKTYPVPGRPNAAAIGGGRAWIASFDNPRLRVFDAKTGRRGRSIDIGTGTSSLATGFGSLWILNQIDGSLRRRSLGPGGGLSKPVDVVQGQPVHAQVVTTGEGGVWIAARSIRPGVEDFVARVRPNDVPLHVVKKIPMPMGAQSIAVGYGAAWVVNTRADTVTRIDLVSGAQTTANVGRNPRAIAVGGGWVWVANRGNSTVTAIRPSSLETKTIRVGQFPQGIDVSGGYAWVPGYGDNTLTRIGVRTRRVAGKPLTMPLNPKAVAGLGHDVWVTSTSDNSVTHVRF